jgi:hypothetical protein
LGAMAMVFNATFNNISVITENVDESERKTTIAFVFLLRKITNVGLRIIVTMIPISMEIKLTYM